MSNPAEDNKYENIIQRMSDEQLIYEQAILNKQYRTIYAQKKMIEDELDRRLNKSLESNRR